MCEKSVELRIMKSDKRQYRKIVFMVIISKEEHYFFIILLPISSEFHGRNLRIILLLFYTDIQNSSTRNNIII